MKRPKINSAFFDFSETRAVLCNKIKPSKKEAGDSIAVLKNYSQKKQIINETKICRKHLQGARNRIDHTNKHEKKYLRLTA